MDLAAPVDLYCERLGPGLFAEPLNAISNFAFLGASAWTWHALPSSAAWYARALAAWIAVIGLCSLSFHTFANAGTEILDVASIGVFILGYVACFFLRFDGRPLVIAAGVLAYLALNLLAARIPPQAYNGSAGYFPALVYLAALAAYLGLRGLPGAGLLAVAAGVFALSLFLRSEDRAWCTSLPIGTHWLWHCLNAAVLSLANLGLAPAASHSGASPGAPR